MKFGVIDIGSNAIRVVVYEGDLLGSPVIFHSKFKCDLKGLLDKDEDNYSNQIYAIFEYFSYYFQNNNVSNVKCVATEVLRKHSKAEDFIKVIKEKYHLDIEILTGQEEATLAAKGLISGMENVNGLGIDFGGGSLELIKITNNQIEKTISIPFGTNLNKDSISIDKVFESISDNFLGESFTNLYLMGGTFRVIGRNYMYLMNYHLKVLHNINISMDNLYKYINIVETSENLNLTDSQQDAIKIIRSVVDITGARNIIISSYGLKEGVRFQYLLNSSEIGKNMVYERTKIVTGFDGDSSNLKSYFAILQNLDINNLDKLEETLYLAIMFTRFYFKSGNSIGSSFVYDFVMSSDIPFTEQQRILLIASLSTIFLHNIPFSIKKLCKLYLSSEEYAVANIVGNFIRIASEIDGTVMYKPNFNFTRSGKFIEVKTDYILPAIIHNKIKYNLKELSFFIRKAHD